MVGKFIESSSISVSGSPLIILILSTVKCVSTATLFSSKQVCIVTSLHDCFIPASLQSGTWWQSGSIRTFSDLLRPLGFPQAPKMGHATFLIHLQGVKAKTFLYIYLLPLFPNILSSMFSHVFSHVLNASNTQQLSPLYYIQKTVFVQLNFPVPTHMMFSKSNQFLLIFGYAHSKCVHVFQLILFTACILEVYIVSGQIHVWGIVFVSLIPYLSICSICQCRS